MTTRIPLAANHDATIVREAIRRFNAQVPALLYNAVIQGEYRDMASAAIRFRRKE